MQAKYFLIHPADAYSKVEASIGIVAGLYKLHQLAPDGSVTSIHRLKGPDPDGVLYIGSSAKLPHRFGSLRKGLLAAVGGEYSSTAAHTVAKNFQRARDFFCIERMAVTFYPTDATTDRYAAEQLAIDEYIAQFGEAPPFNERLRV